MAVYTVKVMPRKRPTRILFRKRLRGNARTRAKAAKRFLEMALAFDQRLIDSGEDIDGLRLIFAGDENAMSAVADVIETLAEALTDTKKIIKS